MFDIAHQVMATDGKKKGGQVGWGVEVTSCLQGCGKAIYIFCHVGSQTAHACILKMSLFDTTNAPIYDSV